MGELSQLRKQQTRQKQRSEPQNSLQEQARSQVLSPARFYGATGRREPWERGWLQEKQERHQKLLEGLQRSPERSYCHEYQ